MKEKLALNTFVMNVVSQDLIKMGTVVVTLKVMPESVDINLKDLTSLISKRIKKFCGEEPRTEVEPIAFGLKALIFIFLLDESKGGTDKLEEEINNIEGVNSVDVTDVRRALG